SGRYDYTRIESVDAITPLGEPGSLSGTHRFRHFNPAVGFTFSPTGEWTWYLGVNEGTRAPSAIELGCADPENPCKLPNAMAGDPPLDQVRTRTWETGVRGRAGEALSWNVGFFRADNRDDILFVADDQSGFGYFRNFGQTRRQGIELGLQGRAGPVTLSANYTLLDASFRSAEEVGGEGNSTNEEGPGFEGTIDIEEGDKIPLIPRHIFKLGVGVDLLPQLTATADLISIGGSYARGNENNEHEADGVYYLGSGRSGGYTVVNLGTEFRPTSQLTVFAQLNNALDRKYSTGAQLGSTGFNAAGNFVARPFAGPIVDGERPLTGSTFYAAGMPRSYWLGARYKFFGGNAN
ncbi:MAG: TonB-dependent receptor, partial [Steroidobacteraceae bacterium]